MKVSIQVLFFTYIAAVLAGCGDSSGSNNENNPLNKPVPQNRVNWSAVPAEFNPQVEDITFGTAGYSSVRVDAFGFKSDAEVVYSSSIPAGLGYLRLYKVFKDSASWGRLESSPAGSVLNLTNYGQYQCSIRITNGQITQLKGGCYVRLQVLLPKGSEIEVYNVGQLISSRFVPISTSDFLQELDSARGATAKFAVIDNFLASYSGTSRAPSLAALELGIAIGEFSWKEEKYKALQRLHSFVRDQERLGEMINDRFSYFEREEARRIVGL